MKREGKLRPSSSSSSSGRKTVTTTTKTTTTIHHVANSVGCMARVFQLLSSKYHTHRKFLTFGKKQHRNQTTMSSSSTSSLQRSKTHSSPRKRLSDENAKTAAINECSFRRMSSQVPRSPTITPDIRRSSSVNSPVASVVARLMGLEDAPPPPPSPVKPDLATDKRRKLLGALEKCDEDLQALKRIIEAVRGGGDDRSKMAATPVVVKKCTDEVSGSAGPEQPSPVSVLEDFFESPPSPPPEDISGGGHSYRRGKNDMFSLGRLSQQQQRKKKKEENHVVEIARIHFHDQCNNRVHIPCSLFHLGSERVPALSPPSWSSGTSMEKAVGEVCRDVETGHRREVERLGAVVEDFIYRDLIEEMTKCLIGRRRVEPCLPYEKCKRKLRF